MRAAMLMVPSKIEFKEIARPEPQADEVLIQPIRVGICGTDLSFYHGHRQLPSYPFLLGHELVGRVVAVGDGVAKLKAGQRVVVEPNYPCGVCSFCFGGRARICPHKRSMGVTVPGCFADYAVAPAEYVWALPDSISDLDAATIEPLTVSLHALLESGAKMADTIAVVGCGVIGQLLIHIATRQGIKVIAHDKVREKLDLATRLGAVVSETKEPQQLWATENVMAVFECAGVPATVELCVNSAPRGARVLILGLTSSPASFVPFRLVREGIRVEGSLIYDHPADFARSISLVESGFLQPSCIVTDTLEFKSIGEAMELASVGRSCKVHAVMD